MQEITLSQILNAREQRVAAQRALLSRYQATLICFTMNIPGPIKMSPLIKRAFLEGCTAVERILGKEQILYRNLSCPVTGCCAIYVVKQEAKQIKRACIGIEEGSSLGRLFDIDVFAPNGEKLERPAEEKLRRGCIVCGAQGRNCASRRLHSVQELQNAAKQIMENYFAETDATKIAALAVQSLLDEAATTPKPGLVDMNNTGSHRDMDFSTFQASALSLSEYFLHCVKIGQQSAQKNFETTFSLLRQEGLHAQQRMYQATGGVNTHKGAIYTIGLLCGAAGRLWSAEHPYPESLALLACCANLAEKSTQKDFCQIAHQAAPRTAGEEVYLQYGLSGVRGEVAAGLPSVKEIGIPVFHAAISRGLSKNDAGAITLLYLMEKVTDTNLYRRGGLSGAQYAAQAAANLLLKNPFPSMEEISVLDADFIAKNLSPGGSADLLAAVYFLYEMEQNLLDFEI